MVMCCVYGCSNPGNAVFPRDETLRKQWTEAICREKSFVVKKTTKLCWKHFRPEDFMQESYTTGAPLVRKKLKKGVVPSVFFWRKQVQPNDEDPKPGPSPVIQPTSTTSQNSREAHSSLGLVSKETGSSVPEDARDRSRTILSSDSLVKESITESTDSHSVTNTHSDGQSVSIPNEDGDLVAGDLCEVVLSETIQPPTPVTVKRKKNPKVTRLKKLNIDTSCDAGEKNVLSETTQPPTPITVKEKEIPKVSRLKKLIVDTECEAGKKDVLSETTQPPTPMTVKEKDIPKVSQLEKLNVHRSCEIRKKDVCVQAQIRYSIFSVEHFKTKTSLFLYYTGLESYEKFIFVFGTLGPGVSELNYRDAAVVNVSLEDQFLITLIKLRRATPDFELGVMFDISDKTAGNIFVSWVLFMSRKWKENNTCPSRGIDGTEVFNQKPTDPAFQQASRSTNKQGKTTSDPATGEISDLLHEFDHNDSIMDDAIQDSTAKDTTINSPSFFKEESILVNNKPATKRIHIYSVVEMAKTFKILNNKSSPKQSRIASEILYCCAMLCKFREGY